MIATRFRAVRLAAGISAAALACYLVSLQVAAERGHLMKMERNILAARADIRQLRTELDTRGRLVQLERWNAQVLGLQAPKVEQYAADALHLAAYAPARVTQVIQANLTTAAAPPAPAQIRTVALRPVPTPAPTVRPVATQTSAFRPAGPIQQALVHHAGYAAPSPASLAPRTVAMTTARPAKARMADLLPAALLTDIGRAAAAETRLTRK